VEQTWRWFGDNDPIPLAHVRQAGATGIVTALHEIPPGIVWTAEQIAARKKTIEDAGLTWSVCESIATPDPIKYQGEDAAACLAAWKDTLANLGRAGVGVVCYNFMPVVDWTRTDLTSELPNGAFALRFDIVDFVAYDVFVLKRPGAAGDYSDDLVTAAEARFAKRSEEDFIAIEKNVIAGLPGGAMIQSRQTIQDAVARFAGISADDMRRALRDFLREVVPVAEEFGVRLAIHPDDPPRPLFGLPRVVSTAEDARSLLGAVDSTANGLTLCVGSYSSRPDNDLPAIAEEFASRIHFAHLRNVTIEPDGSFYEDEHLAGRTDMVAVVDILLKEEQAARAEGRRASIPMRPDHGHLMAADIERTTNPGYSYDGRMKGLAELRGVMAALQHKAA
jgi:mannonate dehydratase